MSSFCTKCGEKLDAKEKFCPGCGKKVTGKETEVEKVKKTNAEQEEVVTVSSVPQSNSLATAGFVVSLITFCCCTVLSPVGLILSIVGLVRSKDCGGAGKGLSIAGIIISALAFIIFVVAMIVIIATGGIESTYDI